MPYMVQRIYLPVKNYLETTELPHERISVAEVPRLREFSSVAEVAETSGSPNFGKFGYMHPTTFSRGEFL